MPEIDIPLYVIVALLPLAAGMVVVQANPYHALVIRGILGAISALVYALLGAADVALTEALVGTMLAITLYAVAVRSSLLMRLGVLASPETLREPPGSDRSIRKPEPVLETVQTVQTDTDPLEVSQADLDPDLDPIGSEPLSPILPQDLSETNGHPAHAEVDHPWRQVLADLRRVLDKRHLRLELVTYPDVEALQQALREKEVHAICTPGEGASNGEGRSLSTAPIYQAQIRIRRLYEILQAELTAPVLSLTYTPVTDAKKP